MIEGRKSKSRIQRKNWSSFGIREIVLVIFIFSLLILLISFRIGTVNRINAIGDSFFENVFDAWQQEAIRLKLNEEVTTNNFGLKSTLFLNYELNSSIRSDSYAFTCRLESQNWLVGSPILWIELNNGELDSYHNKDIAKGIQKYFTTKFPDRLKVVILDKATPN